jgi:outer membrane protein TolC
MIERLRILFIVLLLPLCSCGVDLPSIFDNNRPSSQEKSLGNKLVIEDEITSEVFSDRQKGTQVESALINGGADFFGALKGVLKTHPDVLAAEAAERNSLSLISAVASNKRAQVSGNLMGGFGRKDEVNAKNTQGLAGNLTVSKYIYDGGYVDGTITKQVVDYEAAKESTRVVRDNVGEAASVAWLEYAVANSLLRQTEAAEVQFLPYVRDATRMADTGLVDRTLIDDISKMMLGIDLEKQTALSRLEISKMVFKSYYGKLPGNVKIPGNAFRKTDFKLLSEDLASVPSMRLAAARVISAKEEVSVRTAAFSPKVNLELGLSSPMDADTATSAQAGISLNYIFNDGGRRQANLEAAQSQLARVQQDLQSAKLTYMRSVQVELKTIELLEGSIELTDLKRNMTAQSLEVLASQLKTGQANLKKLIEAQVEHHKVALDLLNKKAQRIEAKFRLASMLGLFSSMEFE